MKIDKVILNTLCDNLKIGLTRADACTIAEISNKKFALWLKNHEFSLAIKKAETEAKKRNIGFINKAAMDHWGAAAYWLEHMYPKEFGEKTKLAFPGMVDNELFESVSLLSGAEVDSCFAGIMDGLSNKDKNNQKRRKRK